MHKLVTLSLRTTLLLVLPWSGAAFQAPAFGTQATANTATIDGSPDGDYCGRDNAGKAVLCNPEELEIIYGNGSAGTSAVRLTGTHSGSGKKYYAYDRLTTGPDGQPCVTTGYAEEGTIPSDPVRTDLVTQNILDMHGLPLDYPPCPPRPTTPGQPAQLETPSMVARRAWELVPLPDPRPTIRPGRGITGKLAYLETNGSVTHSYSTNTVFGALVISATGSYSVDWGDGEKSGPYAFEGRAWPDGQITHDYLNVGMYDIVVTERWTATWSLGGQRGVLRTLQTTGRIDDFPVQQIQAVVGP